LDVRERETKTAESRMFGLTGRFVPRDPENEQFLRTIIIEDLP
jgi:hypothetical protein